MTTAPVSLQDLRQRMYDTAKADTTKRFWGLYVHVAKLETLRAGYDLAKRNNGAPGVVSHDHDPARERFSHEHDPGRQGISHDLDPPPVGAVVSA